MANYNILLNVVDEIIAKVGFGLWDKLTGKVVDRGATPLTAEQANVAERGAEEAIGLLFGGAPGIKPGARKNFIAAHAAIKASSPKLADRFERAFGEWWTKVKNGTIPPGTEEFVETKKSWRGGGGRRGQPRDPGSSKESRRTTKRNVYLDGWAPNEVFVNMVNSTGRDIPLVKAFVDWILQDTIWDNVGSASLELKEAAVRYGKRALIAIAIAYPVLLVLSALGAWLLLGSVVSYSDSVLTLLGGAFCALVFFLLISIPIYPFVNKR